LQIIGADGTCNDIEVDTICNGPLKPATSYRFKLRLYTSPDMWTDSEYSEIATTNEETMKLCLLYLLSGKRCREKI
uniref:Fibronectin type-III domain-containing protein n=1 Tax=Brugia pahangi TaxID=6280 RepID=A0A0N4T2I3_BRUPA